MVRYTVNYVGRVQGVSFRYTTTRIAQRYAVAGYVQNLPDASVSLVAEGEDAEVQGFLQAVNEQLSRYIESHSEDKSDASGQFGQPDKPDTFTIRY